MHRALLLAFVILPVLIAVALACHGATAGSGAVTFSGRIVDPARPLVPGAVVTVHGTVIARSETCIEARVSIPQQPHSAALWLCSHGSDATSHLPDIGDPVTARARITGMKSTSVGNAPRSDSFILLNAG
jgi:type 1 fimbria pilin